MCDNQSNRVNHYYSKFVVLCLNHISEDYSYTIHRHEHAPLSLLYSFESYRDPCGGDSFRTPQPAAIHGMNAFKN